MTNGKTVINGKINLPSVLPTLLAVTKDSLKSAVATDGVCTVDEIRTPDHASARKAAGLTL